MARVIHSAGSIHGWRSEPGSYLLLIEVKTLIVLEVGRLGRVSFPPGRYAYAGSALGSGGAAARLERHLRPTKALHWHIDYLTAVAPVAAALVSYGAERLECTWAQGLQACEGAWTPASGFGCTDCRSVCKAHLWRLPDHVPLSWIEVELTRCPIQVI
jgi:Uri superfamily endonuclease